MQRFLSMKRSRLITIGIVGIGLIPLAVISSFRSIQETKAASLNDCIKEQAEREKVAESQGYQLFQAGRGKMKRDYLIRYKSGECTLVNRIPGNMHDDLPLSSFIKTEIALELNRQRYGKIINTHGGLNEYQKSFQEKIGDEIAYMPSDVYESLVSLGVKIPDQVIVTDKMPTAKQLNDAQMTERKEKRNAHE